ncbi:MAG: single-stranded-DNA-specific exonuclease RecJ, partial [Ginsengibacter sp.]
MKKRWHILDCNDPTRVKELSESLNISHPLSAILIQRGIDTFIKAKEFFRPTLETLHDPFLMKDMEKAVSRVITAIAAKEKILIFGDYDVDGTTSVALLYRFLKKIHTEENINYYIPHRYREGYGISRQVIEYANENNYSLIISLDCGIKSTELIGYASTLGIDFIVCDHHLPDEELPPAFAILNAKQKGCLYPYKELCGCGVTFKLVTALSHRLGINEQEYMCLLDLVVTAIGADIVPMTGENRVLAYFGLKQLNSSPCAGISALIKLSTLKNGFDISNVVFIIAPRVNAAGRMDEGSHAVKLFIESDPEKAMAFAEILQDHNTERKDTDSTITEEALAMIAADEVLINRKSTVLFQPHWHKGVVGIVASRIIETYHRPTVILAMGDEVAGGSARSVPGFNLYEAIHSCREHLLGYGGHFAAAGMTISPDKIDAFSKKFEEVVAATIPPELL